MKAPSVQAQTSGAALGYFIRKAKASDEAFVLKTYGEAQDFLAASGVDQWQDGYPNLKTFSEDLKRGESYILEAKNEEGMFCPAASFYFSTKPDPDYESEEAKRVFGPSGAYAVIHRVAMAEAFRGQRLSGAIFRFAAREAVKRKPLSILRIDTHRDNKAMQRTLEARGFVCKGRILLRGHDAKQPLERLAYELDSEKTAALAEA